MCSNISFFPRRTEKCIGCVNQSTRMNGLSFSHLKSLFRLVTFCYYLFGVFLPFTVRFPESWIKLSTKTTDLQVFVVSTRYSLCQKKTGTIHLKRNKSRHERNEKIFDQSGSRLHKQESCFGTRALRPSCYALLHIDVEFNFLSTETNNDNSKQAKN